ncbi:MULTISPECIES: 4Fe-4S dicluster domain-containing protein [unclassified Adlercreutzia]|uniref:4Fe-4S dicluster domain-containing protein n=1 Tax=unclassified Adlercreutzia TaxID=2636013 RepID=UPI0013E9B780|nr:MULTISPECIES: 4Fe-4S dicluster domain-containing protein [unclassified Adlercreutzia]
MKTMLIDLEKCVGCYACQIGCKDEHCTNEWMPYARQQPETGQFWMRVDEFERGARPHVKVTYLPVPCQHCENPACVAACADGALSKREDGLVLLDPARCTGCGDCVGACPYGAVYFNDGLGIAQKCTGCAHLIDGDHPISVPRCFDNCVHDAIRYGEESELDLEGAERLHPEYGTGPQIWYKNLPKKFIAGTVYDPVEKEIIEGALCTVRGEAGEFSVVTDDMGDFWLRGLPDAEWTLTIEADGKVKELAVDTTEKDVGLGDVPLA